MRTIFNVNKWKFIVENVGFQLAKRKKERTGNRLDRSNKSRYKDLISTSCEVGFGPLSGSMLVHKHCHRQKRYINGQTEPRIIRFFFFA